MVFDPVDYGLPGFLCEPARTGRPYEAVLVRGHVERPAGMPRDVHGVKDAAASLIVLWACRRS